MGSINKCEIIDGQKVLTPFVQTNSIEDYYSTEEEATNKVWIDGKRIYRKVIQAASFVGTLPVDINNVDDIVDVKFKRQYDKRTQYMDYGDGVGSSSNLLIVKTQNGYSIETVSSGETIYNLTAILEYTKATD